MRANLKKVYGRNNMMQKVGRFSRHKLKRKPRRGMLVTLANA